MSESHFQQHNEKITFAAEFGFRQGEKQMLERAIAAVESALISTEGVNSSWNKPINVALEYLDELRAELKENM